MRSKFLCLAALCNWALITNQMHCAMHCGTKLVQQHQMLRDEYASGKYRVLIEWGWTLAVSTSSKIHPWSISIFLRGQNQNLVQLLCTGGWCPITMTHYSRAANRKVGQLNLALIGNFHLYGPPKNNVWLSRNPTLYFKNLQYLKLSETVKGNWYTFGLWTIWLF